MNYEPNTITWKIGDLVIHDADAKFRRMLMRVERHLPNGMYLTKYILPQSTHCRLCGHKVEKYINKTFKNDKEVLHDPRKFGIEIDNL